MKDYNLYFLHFPNSFTEAALGDIAQATVMVHVLIGKMIFFKKDKLRFC